MYVLDTNILIYYFDPKLDSGVIQTIEDAIGSIPVTSIVTRLELLGWRLHTPQSRREMKALLEPMTEIGLTPDIVEQVIAIKSTHAMKLPDAIIAATALEVNLPLLTRNVGDFSRIKGLRVINPFETTP
jgi:predicted nucleic acid-binding protein